MVILVEYVCRLPDYNDRPEPYINSPKKEQHGGINHDDKSTARLACARIIMDLRKEQRGYTNVKGNINR